jgi:hypothetical protein
MLRSAGVGWGIASIALRTIEAGCYVIGTVFLLSTVSTVRDLRTVPGSIQRTSVVQLAQTLVDLRDHAIVAGVVAFAFGAFAYYRLFFRLRVVPRWLSVWGMVGTALMLVTCIVAIIHDRPVTGYVTGILPIAAQELVLACWLLIKGVPVAPPRPTASLLGAS